MDQVSYSMKQSGARRSDQSGIWDDISMKQARMHTASPTGSMSDMVEARAKQLGDCQQAFKWTEGQAGAVFAVGGKVIGLELFDSDRTFAKFLAKLVSSYALDAIEIEAGTDNAAAAPTLDQVRALIERERQWRAVAGAGGRRGRARERRPARRRRAGGRRAGGAFVGV